MRNCWCGHAGFAAFNDDYQVCRHCGTLVSQNSLTDDQLRVVDDEADFYGKQYWLGHQADDLGFPDIQARARADLTERNLHWLKTLLKYRLPPGRTVEIGCAHGSFVALMRVAGFDASGVEMSRWVVEFGRRAFGIPVEVGPVENVAIEAGSLDAVALMDVLEHLPDPLSTMRHCLGLLKPGGLLLIQTPCFEPDMRFDALVRDRAAFLEQLKADEHLYLFTRDSVRELFARLGASHLAFEPAIFAQYDMFFAVGREPLIAHGPEDACGALTSSPSGRLALALLDLRDRELATVARLHEAESDRAARGEKLETLTTMVVEAEADRAARADQIATLTTYIGEIERDRDARATQIVELTRLLGKAEEDRNARGDQIETLTAALTTADADRIARGEQIATLARMLAEAEADRAARKVQIDALGDLVARIEADRTARGEQIVELDRIVRETEADRAARGEQIAVLNGMLAAAEADRSARGGQISELNALLAEAEADRAARGEQIETLTRMLVEAREHHAVQ